MSQVNDTHSEDAPLPADGSHAGGQSSGCIQPTSLEGLRCVVRSPSAPVSVVILTHNEATNIAECLASCAWCDDVHVLDSGSTDQTRAIAEQMGAYVHVHPFESFGAQRNWAITHIPTRHDWIFHLDADERFTPDLVGEMRRRLDADPSEAGYYIPQKLMFMGRWLKRAAAYPVYQMRLFHKQRAQFRDYGHGQREATTGQLGQFKEPYLHYNFSKGLFEWMEKHNRYSSLEARQIVFGQPEPMRLRDLAHRSKALRWRAWKRAAQHWPGRPWLRWFAILFYHGGVFEGKAGLTYARLIALYEQMIMLKVQLYRTGCPEAEAELRDLPESVGTPMNRSASPLHGRANKVAESPRDRTAEPESMVQMMPESSPWSLMEKIRRALWMVVGRPLFWASFHNWYRYRAWLLRRFGARVGRNVTLRPTVRIEIPWNLDIEDDATVGDHAILYSLGKIHIGKRAIISQYSHLCAGTHDYTDHRFPLIRTPITIQDDVWIGADAFIGPGVTVGRLTVVGARSSVYKDLPPRKVCVGNPARPIKDRLLK